ncbi:MAG: hypothetical protein EBY39_07370 [Flavobacteriia bacterium]|nr:hypothetical protein [Flavobacteriia bacterium]
MKILTCMLTCSGDSELNQACKATWLKHINSPHELWICGDKKMHDQDSTIKWFSDTEEGIHSPKKILKIMESALEKKWDFLFKCTSKTYVNFAKLKSFLENFDTSSPMMGGHHIYNDESRVLYCQGGAGYFITKPALQAIIPWLRLMQNSPEARQAEDLAMGYCAKLSGKVKCLKFNDFFHTASPNCAENDQKKSCIGPIVSEGKITSNYTTADSMRRIHDKLSN